MTFGKDGYSGSGRHGASGYSGMDGSAGFKHSVRSYTSSIDPSIMTQDAVLTFTSVEEPFWSSSQQPIVSNYYNAADVLMKKI